MDLQSLAGFHSSQQQHHTSTPPPPPSKDSLLYTDLLSSVDQLLGDAGNGGGGGAAACPGGGSGGVEVDAAAEFESACGSPEQPVDLTALDGISLDFPLNSYGDITYPGRRHFQPNVPWPLTFPEQLLLLKQYISNISTRPVLYVLHKNDKKFCLIADC